MRFSNAGSRSSRGGCVGGGVGGVGGGGSSAVQTLIVPPERQQLVGETTFVMHVTNSPEESVEDDDEDLSRNPTPPTAAPPAAPLRAANGTCGNGGGAVGEAPTTTIRCASPVCPHRRRRSSAGRNGFHSQGSQTEARRKPATAADQVSIPSPILAGQDSNKRGRWEGAHPKLLATQLPIETEGRDDTRLPIIQRGSTEPSLATC